MATTPAEQQHPATSEGIVKLNERLDQIRSQPKQQNQQQTGVVLSAVEDTLRDDQKTEFTPTAYFAALLSLLNQYVSAAGIVNKDVATAVVYLLDLVTPHVPTPLLRSKFEPILTSLAPSLTHPDADAPFLRSAIGCLVSLLVVQDNQAWARPQSQVGPRQAAAGLLNLSVDHRPKVRKRAQEGLAVVLQSRPPGPSRDHPAAEMCAETALRGFQSLATLSGQSKKQRGEHEHEPELIHTMQLIKTIASASGGWPARSLDSLCEVLFAVARSKSEFLTMTAFDVFEAILAGMANEDSSDKIARLLDAITELQPSQNDTQLLPPWIAIISRGYDVYAQVEPDEAFQKLPIVFESIAAFMASPSFNIRISASECLVSFMVNCVPPNVLLEPSVYDEKTLEKLAATATNLFSVKYQSAWMEVFTVLGAMLENLRWQSWPLLSKPLATVGELRSNESFAGKDAADAVISKAITAIGPDRVLEVLPLNLAKSVPGQPGRAWMLPLLRDNISNTRLGHFKKELVPLSELLFQRVMAAGEQKTMETKIFETLVQQIWACLPGYCDRPLDLQEAFDQAFAEMISKLLYQQPEMRLRLCQALQNLVEGFKAVASTDEAEPEDLILQGRISRADAQKALDYMSTFSSNMLAVLFNVYGETATGQRGPILACVDAFLSITKPAELAETFARVSEMLDSTLKEANAAEKPTKANRDQKNTGVTPMTHALMDIVVAMSIYIPRDSFQSLFGIASALITQKAEPQLQKKAYKLIPRLSSSETGVLALTERGVQLRQMLIDNAENTVVPARKDRLNAIAEVVRVLSPDELYFIPSVLPEVILCTKETNERAREAAFDLIVTMGEKMQEGGTIDNSKVTHMAADAAPTTASIDEFFTMLSAGLAGTTPHMISASVTALSRALYQFKDSLSEPAITDIVQTMDLFLKSPTREVVRSVLGFIKICVISLPIEMMTPRLHSLVPSLMTWSHEHKAHFRAKVKNILERMIRRYGFAAVEAHCPPEDKKLITNIRKTRERRKRKRATDGEEGDDAAASKSQPQHAKYGNEFDEAIYGSDDDSAAGSGSDDDAAGAGVALRAQNGGKARRTQQAFIHEDGDEPLDLLDKRSLAHISSTRPLKARQTPGATRLSGRSKVDVESGKLLLGADGDSDSDAEMGGADGGEGVSLESGINAYVDAIRSRDAPQRGQKGKLKFTNKPRGGFDEDDEDGDDGMEVDQAQKKPRPSPGKGEIARGGGRGRGGGKFPQRRGLGVEKSHGRGGAKSPRGRGGFGGRGGGRGRAR
ncbi:hypothetical protein FH972_023292 [Carpinus fangiana]|uniref:Uncharacterized protein n=1 Tax=Carpinus fangiana TaxID=176857 RepID=A0A5N6KV68_9ROSI|nr:hypothetical protein FH972_023292 [Carpinus fangiana]